MNDIEALKQLKAGPVNQKLKGPGSYSKELKEWYDKKFISLTWKISNKFGFSQQVAEEITQVVLLKAVSNIEDVKNEFALNKWLSLIVQRTCIDEIRKQTYIDKNESNIKTESKASVIKVTEVNGVKVTEYSYVEPNKGSRKLKFDVVYSKLDDEDERPVYELIEEFASDFNLDDQTPEVELINKEQESCIDNAISKFKIIDADKAEAIRLLMLDTPNVEIAMKLNKSPTAIREYLSQCYKKFKLFVKPCYEEYKLA